MVSDDSDDSTSQQAARQPVSTESLPHNTQRLETAPATTAKVVFSPFQQVNDTSSHAEARSSRAPEDRRISRRSSLSDDRVDEVINNLTNMHSMVKLLRDSSVDKPDSSRTWDDLASDLEDERTARIIAEEAASSSTKQADAAAAEAAALRRQLALLTEQLSSASLQRQTQEEASQQHESQQQLSNDAVSSLQQQVEHATAESQSVREQLARLNEQLAEEQSKNQQLRQEAASMVQQTAAAAEVTGIQQQLADVTHQLAEERIKAEQLTMESAESSRAQSNAAAAQIASLHEQLTDLTQQLTSKQRELDAFASSTQGQSESASAELLTLRERISAQNEQISTQREESAKLSARLRDTEERMSSKQQLAESSVADISSLREQLSELTQQLESQCQETRQLAEQHGQSQQSADSSKQQAEAAVAEAANLHEQLAELTQQLAAQQQAQSSMRLSQADNTQTDSASVAQQADSAFSQASQRQVSGAEASSSGLDKPTGEESHAADTAALPSPGATAPDVTRGSARAGGLGADLAPVDSEPDLATGETLDPDSAVASPARLQSPDQALPGISAFQARLHSMLPQLPTLDKLAQLTLEEWWGLVGNEFAALMRSHQWAQAQVGRLEGLESEVDQLQNVLQSVATELESGHQQAQVMQRRTAAAEHLLRKAELRVRSAELRAQSAESELLQLRKLHAQQAKRQGSPWKGPGLKPTSPRASRPPGFEPRLLEPEDQAWNSPSDINNSSSAQVAGCDDTSSEAQAAPKEADQDAETPSTAGSARDCHKGQLKKSKGSGADKGGRSARGSAPKLGSTSSEGARAAPASRSNGTKVLPITTTHPLHQKRLPDSRFDSPARSLPPYLRSYRSFTRTALLTMNGGQPEEVLPESLGQIPALGRIPAGRSSSMIRGSKGLKGERLTKARSASVQPVVRQACVPTAALNTGRATPRVTYGMDSAFAAAKQQYEMQRAASNPDDLTEHDRTQNWLKSLTANKVKQASDPKRVDQLVSNLQQLMQENGLDVPMKKCGPCQYKLGSYMLSLKVGSNRLLVRCGGGYEDLMSAMEKMPQYSA